MERESPEQIDDAARRGLLLARPGPPKEEGPKGLQLLGQGAFRGAALYVPAGYMPDHPAPLVVMLHGAMGVASSSIRALQPFADGSGMILLAPESRSRTWDLLVGGFGPDIAFIDRMLRHVFDRYAVDPAHLAIEGISDGASYALSVGITNGDLFSHIMAFSPGFLRPAGQRGAPGVFISHGVFDEMLRIDFCSRRIVPLLVDAGYAVRYLEFDGGHAAPPEVQREGVSWFLQSSSAAPPPAT